MRTNIQNKMAFSQGQAAENKHSILKEGRYCTFVLPPIVIDDSSWKNAAESFTVALTLTLGGYESAIASKEDEVPGAKLLKEPEKWVVEELKRWLECHGLKKSGKKAELIIRVRDGLKLNFPVDPKIDGGKWYNLKTEDSASIENTNSKTSIASLGDLPTDGWRLFPTKNLPANFNYGHVYFYLVESAAKASNIPDSNDSDEDSLYANCDTVIEKPLKKGRNLLSSGSVENVQHNFDDIKHEFYVLGHVQHSMKNMLPLNVNVVISDDISGYVKVAMCDCKANALGRCAHVAALLLNKIEWCSTW